MPIQHGGTVDFRTLDLRSNYHVALEGFMLAPKRGWRFIGDSGDVIFYLRLSASIEIEVWRLSENVRPASVSIGYADVEREITFGENEHENKRVTR